MKELEIIVSRYFSKDTNISVYTGDAQNSELELNKLFQNMVAYESPDILSFYDNKIVGIEHFEFDSYNNSSRKGSDFRTKENEISKKFDDYLAKTIKKKTIITLSDTIKPTSTLKNYYNNFHDKFLNHYKKIDRYLENVKNDFKSTNKEIEIWFFAEDVSPLGSYYMNKEKEVKLLHPFLSVEMIMLLENSSKLSGIILGVYAGNSYKVIVIYNTKDGRKKLKEDFLDLNDEDFFSFEPHTTGYAVNVLKK